jgi:hypothetical protein
MRIVILGCGDLVRQRLLPALLKATPDGGLPIPTLASVLLLSTDATAPPLPAHATIAVSWRHISESETIQTDLMSADGIIVATPSYAHLGHLEAALAVGVPVAVEKPLTCLPHEVTRIEALAHTAAFERVFALSYYVLEKALPLLYLCGGLTCPRDFLPFLTFESTRGVPASDSDGEVLDISRICGALRSVRVTILEAGASSGGGADRAWTDLRQYGGQLLETFIHSALLADRIAGPCASWEGEWKHRWSKPRVESSSCADGADVGPGWSSFSGQKAGVAIRLETGKYVAATERRRQAEVEFENGRLICDFDRRWCSLESPSTALCARIPESWNNYQVQMRLFGRLCVEGRMAPGRRYDGLAGQIGVLRWLMEVGTPPFQRSSSDLYG